MKDRSQGMVAIIQGLQDAGLAVTLVGRGAGIDRSATNAGRVSHAKSSVETRASSQPTTNINATAPLCDDRFISSYQLAHCKTKPTASPPNSPEFPRQRIKASTTQGNFEIGPPKNVESQAPIKISFHQKNVYSNPHKGLSSTQSSKGTEAFINSLRKYPSISPDRNLSSDILQRLITYTQSKNSSKSSSRSRVMRRLRNRILAGASKNGVRTVKSSKSVQTYTRLWPQSREIENLGRRRSGRSKDVHISTTYNYLATPRRFGAKVTDVRYLSDVTRCLRDTIRQICDDQTQVCPNVQSRYSRHRREHHHDYMEPRSSTDSNDIEAQVSVPMVSKGVSCLSSCEAMPGVSTYTRSYSSTLKLCCYCRKPVPCNCKTPKEDTFQREIENAVTSWLQELPVYYNDNPQNKIKRENKVIDLINKLKALDHDENFEENAKNEILECVNNLSIWFPADGYDRDIFKMQIVDKFMEKIQSLSSYSKIRKRDIAQWVDDISIQSWDNQGNAIDKNCTKDKLMEKLATLESNLPSDETLQNKLLEILNEIPIKFKGDGTNYKADIAQMLIKKLNKNNCRSDNYLSKKYEKHIWDLLQETPGLSKCDIANGQFNRKRVKSLATKLQHLQSRGIHNKQIHDEMQNEIYAWLKHYTENLDSQAMNKLCEKLTEILTNESTTGQKGEAKMISGHCKDLYREQILEWLNDIPELSRSKSENQKLANGLVHILQKNIADGNKQNNIENEITDWLLDDSNTKGIKLDAMKQSNLTKELAQKIDTANIIIDSLNEIPGFNVTSHESTKLANQLCKKLQVLKQNDEENLYKETTNNEIADWLSNLLRTEGLKLTPQETEKFANKLLLSIVDTNSKQRKRWSNQKNLKDTISGDTTKDFIIGVNRNNNKKNQNHIFDKNILEKQTLDDDASFAEVVEILEKEGGLSPIQSKHIADKISTKGGTSNVSHILEENEFDPRMQEKISNVLDCTQGKIEKKDEIGLAISNILTDQAMRGENIDQAKARLLSVLENSNIYGAELETIANQLMEIGKDLFTNSKRQSDETHIFQSLSSTQRQKFKDSAQNEIFNFTKDFSEDSSFLTSNKWKVAAANLAEQVSYILFDSSIPSVDKNLILNREVLQYFQGINLEPSQGQYKLTKELVSRLQNLAFATSTPRNSNTPKNTYFPPHKKPEDLTISVIAENSHFDNYKKQHPVTKEEKQYTSKLEHKIDNWLQILPINGSTEDGKGFREMIIKGLADDIVDRQKYLQLNPDNKTSDEEELEHLKYQVFRWFNKLSINEELMPSNSKTHELMKLTKDIPVPQFIKDTIRKYTTHNSHSKHKSNIDSLRNEVADWIVKAPSYLFTSSDEKHHSKMIEELANDIDQYQNNNTLTETVLDNLILKWLEKMLNGSKQSLENKSKELKNVLVNHGIVSLSDCDSSKDSRSNHWSNSSSNFQDNIDKWIKSLPLKSRTSTDMKKIEILKNDLIDNLTKIQQQYPADTADYNNKTQKAIEKYLQLLPIKPTYRQNQMFIPQQVMKLFEKLKPLHAKTISDMTSVSNDSIQRIFQSWFSNLPIKPDKLSSHFNKDLDQLLFTVNDMLKNKNSADSFNDIEEQINLFLNKIPLQTKVTKDDLHDLMKKLTEFVPSSTVNSLNSTTDGIYNDILNWCNHLPLFSGDTPEDIEKLKILKQNITSQLTNKIGELNMKPDIFHDNSLYENLLKEEIDDVLATLPQMPEMLKNVDLLKNNLIEKAKRVKQKTQNELAGHAYKQQLRDAISSLPSVENIMVMEQVPFEVLKDTVADAYINLRYTPDDELKNKYKQKILDEINKFCDDYLKRFPASPMDPKVLNQEFHTALQKVPRPKDETIKSQVEQVRIKEQVQEWLKAIPLGEKSPEQQLQQNKIVSVLANALYELEKEKKINSTDTIENKMRHDIVKWIKKLSLTSEEKKQIDEKADELIKKLKSTENSRRFSISDLNQPIGAVLEHKSPYNQNQISQSSLSKEDRAHLERIRQRAQRSQYWTSPPICLCKDASVSPIPVDASSQTGVQQRQPFSPNININEYNWESTDTASRNWDSRNESEQNSHLPAFGTSHLNSGKQQTESLPQNYQPQEQNMIWSQPFTGRNSNIMPHNQNGALQSSPYLTMPTPCMQKAPPCMLQSQQQYVSPTPNYAEPRSTNNQLHCVPPQPACALKSKSDSPSPSFISPSSFHYKNLQPPCQQPFLVMSPQPCTSFQPPCIPPSASASPPCILQVPATPLPSTIQSEFYTSQSPPFLSQNSPLTRSQIQRQPQSCSKSSDLSNGSSPADEFSQDRPFNCQPVTRRIGSPRNISPCITKLTDQLPGGKTPRESPEEEYDCKQTADDGWGLSCARRRPIRVPFSSTRYGNNEKEKCHCKERCIGKCSGRRARNFNHRPCLTTDSMQNCTKCCGVHCPHPSYLYFK